MPGALVLDTMDTDSPVLRKDFHLVAEDDIVYEQDIIRNAGSPKPWLEYINHKRHHGSLLEQAFVFERACTALPRSYKIWKMYLELRVRHLIGKNAAKFEVHFQRVNSLFERALVLLNKMPRIWEMYLAFLMRQPLVTTTRHTFDRALQSLPLTQHDIVWPLYKQFAKTTARESQLKIWARYMQVHAEDVEDYIELLVDMRRYTEAVQKYIEVLNNPRYKSKHLAGPFQLWLEMIELFVNHPKNIRTGDETGIDVEAIIRSGMSRFKDQQGKLWIGLAQYWINLGNYEKGRDMYEEAITTVGTVRDFGMVFDRYIEAEEEGLGKLMDAANKRVSQGRVDEDADLDLEIRMDRLEQLMNRRPFLLNDVLLRQAPNSVFEWQKRVGLWGNNDKQVVQTYTDAIATIDPLHAVGRFHELWTNYAKFYESKGDLKTARLIMEKATTVSYKSVNELAEMWCQWAEMELRHEAFDRAVEVMKTATQAPKTSNIGYFDDDYSVQQRVHKSSKLWAFYVDLVESVGELSETRAVYERMFDLRIATPQIIVNYANMLEENDYFEDAFRVYERGLGLFNYPIAFELWNLYLTKAVERQVSIERLRDLFEQAVEGCPPEFAKPIYLMYGALEEERGLARHAMRIYERATRAVSEGDRSELFNFYITKSASNFGLPSTRAIYERAIVSLPDRDAKNMCVKFAEMERRLGEIDRARAIYGHASQFADPRVDPGFWSKWESFEVQHGNEDTYREMLRVKRSVQALFNTDVSFVATQAVSRAQGGMSGGDDDADTPEGQDAMARLEAQSRTLSGFVSASTGPQGGNIPREEQQQQAGQDLAADPNEIDLDD